MELEDAIDDDDDEVLGFLSFELGEKVSLRREYLKIVSVGSEVKSV